MTFVKSRILLITLLSLVLLIMAGVSATAGGQKEVHVGLSTEPWDLDPAIGTDEATANITRSVYDPLIELDKSNEPTTNFALCKGWEWKNNKKTIVLFLREGVKFHDGSDFTAADVKYDMEWRLDPENVSPFRPLLGPINSINIIDDYTLEVNFLSVFTDALQWWSRGMDGVVKRWSRGQRSLEKGGPSGTPGTDLSRNPFGTGPFKFVEWVSGSHITLEKNDDYWTEGIPVVDKVVFEFYGDPTSGQAALIAGSFDIIDKVQAADFESLSKRPGIVTDNSVGTQMQVTLLNMSSPPFGISADQIGNKEAIERAYNLRKFLFHAIDREAIKEKVFYGLATIIHGFWYPDSDWTSPNLKGMTLYDPELAREYLAKAGYPEGGFRFRLMATNVDWFVDIATIIQEQLRSWYNVDVEVIPIDKSTFFSTLYESEDWDAGQEDIGSLFVPLFTLNDFFYRNDLNKLHWHHADPDLPKGYHESVPGHADFVALYDKAIIEPNDQKRKEMVWKLEEMVFSEYAIFTQLMFTNQLTAWRDRLKGYGDGVNSVGRINLRFIKEVSGQ